MRPLLELEGLQRVAARAHAAATRQLEAAVDRLGFYGADGSILGERLPRRDAAAPTVELGALGFDGGAHVLVKLALARAADAASAVARARHAPRARSASSATWCRQQGHRLATADADADGGVVGVVERGPAAGARWVGAERAGGADPTADARRRPPAADWGLAARGAAVEPGGPTPAFALDRPRRGLDRPGRRPLRPGASPAQWDPGTAIDWDAPIAHDDAASRPPSSR